MIPLNELEKRGAFRGGDDIGKAFMVAPGGGRQTGFPLTPERPCDVGFPCREASVSQGSHLMTPGVPRFRKPVTENHEGTCTLLSQVHPYPVSLDGATRPKSLMVVSRSMQSRRRVLPFERFDLRP